MGESDAPGCREVRRILVVNADDFGLTPGVCRGILVAHARGVVTSTSALVVAPAFDDHAAALRDSGLGVGAHLAAVGEDPPLLTAAEIPSLVDRRGRFPQTWRRFVSLAAQGRVDSSDLRREFAAQMERLASAGIEPTHLDSHMNLHLWPQVATVLLELAELTNTRAVRVPRSARRTPMGVAVGALSTRLARRAREHGCAFPEASNGLDERGVDGPLGAADLIRRLGATAAPSAELVTHLGEADDPRLLRYRTRFRWSDELAALCAPSTRAAIGEAGFALGSFADLPTSVACPPVLVAPRQDPGIDLAAASTSARMTS